MCSIDVTGAGAVLLNGQVTCDGFHRDYGFRVQTHIHDDHMDGFDTSKGLQTIYCTAPTRELLIADQNADLPHRSNLIAVEYGVWTEAGHSTFMLLPNGHMLGSAQVVLRSREGECVGYSGDFSVVEQPMKVDRLVLDSTCGIPKLTRKYSQEEAEEGLLNIVRRGLVEGPMFIQAARGTLHRAMMALTGNIADPILGSRRLLREVEVYRRFGQPITHIEAVDSEAGREAIESQRYVLMIGRKDRMPVDTSAATVVSLNAYVPDDRPVLCHSDRSYTVAITDHADFESTLGYVVATGASEVVTDGTRSRHAKKLASEIEARLGIAARCSSSRHTLEWGG